MIDFVEENWFILLIIVIAYELAVKGSILGTNKQPRRWEWNP